MPCARSVLMASLLVGQDEVDVPFIGNERDRMRVAAGVEPEGERTREQSRAWRDLRPGAGKHESNNHLAHQGRIHRSRGSRGANREALPGRGPRGRDHGTVAER